MTKGKSTWKYNKLLTARRNYFIDGGGLFDATKIVGKPGTAESQSIAQNYFNKANSSSLSTSSSNAVGMAGGIASLASTATNQIMGVINSGAKAKTKANNIIAAAKNNIISNTAASSIDELMNEWNNTTQLGKVSAKDLGRKSFGQSLGSIFTNTAEGAAAGSSLGPWGILGGAIGGTVTGIFGSIFGNRAAEKQAARTNTVLEEINAYNQRALSNKASNIQSNVMSNLNANYAAYGGQLFSDGGSIHIKPENRGKFTATKKKTGKTTEELTHSKNPLTRKRAIFAQNARKWHHAFGGGLNTHGADFTNGLISIDNGGSHESNPFEGVPMGFDAEGTPNLVEEGETIFNDYVFSKRLNVPNAIRNKHKLRGNKEISFADASRQMAKESEERPNDPISQRGMQALMGDLAMAQEMLKQEKGETNYAAYGGKVNKHALGTSSLLGLSTLLSASPEDPDWNGPYPYGSNASNPDYGDWATFKFGDTMLYDPTTGKYNDIYTDQGFKDWLKTEGKNAWTTWWSNKSNAPEYYSNKDNTLPTYDDLMKGMYDTQYSDMHKFGAWALNEYMKYKKKPSIIDRHLQTLDSKGNVTGTTPITDWFDDVNTLGQRYLDVHQGRQEVSKSKPVWDNIRGAYVTNIYYRDPQSKESTNRYYYNKGTIDNPEYVLYEGNDAPVWMANNKYYATRNSPNDLNGTDYFYNPQEKLKQGKYADWLRYAPAVGFGIGALTDTLGITNKPDYSNADAILEATSGGGSYQPVRFKPIGNYLTYRPFDRDYSLNRLSAEAGATRRAILQNAGMNRGAGMAAILAADNNTLNQIGNLSRQAEEYNLAQRQQVEDFNRTTNITNSQGFLQADTANQKAQAEMRDFSMKGTLAAAQMREAARQASDAAKSTNISGLFQTLGDIGYEEKNARMRDWAIRHGVFGPGTEDYGRIRRAAKGGKIKRKKGLTF